MPKTKDRGYSPEVDKKTAAYAVIERQRRQAETWKLELADEDDELNWPVL